VPCFNAPVTELFGIVLLLYTRSNIKSGTADLLGLLSYKSRNSISDAEVTREESGCLFWFAIVMQSLAGLGLIIFGPAIDCKLGMGSLMSFFSGW
jgi:hypothetical protein